MFIAWNAGNDTVYCIVPLESCNFVMRAFNFVVVMPDLFTDSVQMNVVNADASPLVSALVCILLLSIVPPPSYCS